MLVISPAELRSNLGKYLDIAQKEKKECVITDEDIKDALTGEELKLRMHNYIDALFDK
ncbi:hypothetical protein Barb4_04259 [Bacteroidales bacterium Barb4]|nr:hypothetical protein Barb4_04259 [Bacteroidales bacterium Barb4]